MKLLFATTNAGKLAELRGLFAGAVEVVSPAELPQAPPEVEEDQPTLQGNAQKKARVLCAASGLLTVADDSGLFVDALGGRPGVQSARYGADDVQRRARLLAELAGVGPEQRTARFICALALIGPGRPMVVELGVCEGRISLQPRGEQGFGYDSLFEVQGLEKTMGELTRGEKSQISHRGRALRNLLPHLK